MPDKPLSGKVALVTGAGSPIGFGRSMSLALVEAGAHVVMMDVAEDWLQRSVAEALDLGGPGSALALKADVSNPEDAERAILETLEAFGALHVLINNAGIAPRHTGLAVKPNPKFWEIPPAAWRRVAEVNYLGPVMMARAAVQPMRVHGWGRIIGVTTSLDTMWRQATYGSTKAAHEAFMAAIAHELEGTGVTANILVPGGPANTHLLPDDTPMDRSKLIQPEVMRAPAVWLASNASDGINGRRFIAHLWDETLPLEERLERASAPAAWQQLQSRAVYPT